MLSVKKINISDEGKKVTFDYELSKEIKKYFSSQKFFVEYDVAIASVPENILIIPFLANVLPISWFAGFDVYVNELDKEFCEAMSKVKLQFEKFYPKILERKSNLIVENLIDSQEEINFTKNAMLFSGGLDAYTTYYRHRNENLDLITIRGADISLDDLKQWDDVLEYNNTTEIINQNKKHYVSSNFREFITFEVEKLIPNLGWWGKVQHGLGLISLVAPLAYLNNYKTLYIGSTRSEKMPFTPWGSMPEIDNLVKWGITNTVHDGYELTRLDKANYIVKESKKLNKYPPLRVCYNEFKNDLNCNVCEKCCRTSFAIMISGGKPQLYGLNPDISLYKKINHYIKNGYSTEGIKFYWNEMLTTLDLKHFSFLEDDSFEKNEINKLIKLNEIAQTMPINTTSKKSMWKHELISKLPKLFNIYLKIRKKLP